MSSKQCPREWQTFNFFAIASTGLVLVEDAEDIQEGSAQMVVVRAVVWKVAVGAAEV